MLEALRLIFLQRHIPYTVEAETIIERQANEIRTVLNTVRDLTLKVLEEFKNEIWSKTLMFLMTVNEQLLSPPSFPGTNLKLVDVFIAQW